MQVLLVRRKTVASRSFSANIFPRLKYELDAILGRPAKLEFMGGLKMSSITKYEFLIKMTNQ